MYGLIKGGVLNAVSIGFSPIESEPIKGGGWRYTKWELLEISVVAVPANPNALVVQRAHKAGAALSAENRDHRDWALKCLSAMGDCMKAIDAARDELRDHLKQAKGHLKALGQKPGDDDEPGAVDDADGEDQEGNNELARAARRKAVEELARRGEEAEARYSRRCPTPPKSWRKIDPARQIDFIASDQATCPMGTGSSSTESTWPTSKAGSSSRTTPASSSPARSG